MVGLEDPVSERTASLAVLVFPVRHSERSVVHLVTLGRAPNNDIVIPDLSVSRFHGFLKQDQDGAFHLQDANSTNGTEVDGIRIPPDRSVNLRSGARIRLSEAIDIFFLQPEDLYQQVQEARSWV